MDNSPYKELLEKEHKRICPIIKDMCVTNNCDFWRLKIGEQKDSECLLINIHRNMTKLRIGREI
jgi:hypothetical protein